MRSTIKDFLAFKFLTHSGIEVFIYFPEVTERCFPATRIRFVETSEVELPRPATIEVEVVIKSSKNNCLAEQMWYVSWSSSSRISEKRHFNMLSNGEINRDIGRGKDVLGTFEDRPGRCSTIGITQIGLQGTDRPFELWRSTNGEPTHEDSSMLQHFLLDPRPVGHEPATNEIERVIEKRWNYKWELVCIVQKRGGDIFNTERAYDILPHGGCCLGGEIWCNVFYQQQGGGINCVFRCQLAILWYHKKYHLIEGGVSEQLVDRYHQSNLSVKRTKK